jgi:hypothetical protein
MGELSRCAAAAAALEIMHGSSEAIVDVFEGDDVVFSPSSSEVPSDLGRVNASESIPAHELVIQPLRKRVQAGGEIRFRITSRVRQEPASVSCAAESFKGIARVIHAQIQQLLVGLSTALYYTVALAAGGEAPGSYVDLVVSVPEDAALGSQVVLRRVIVAGCDVALDMEPVRVIVGFNHAPAPAGRVFDAAQAGDIPSLTQALDDGCSTQEADEVSLICRTSALPPSPPLLPSWSVCREPALL